MLRRAVPRVSRLLPSVLFGIGSAGSSIALLACSAWLIARAAEQPPVLYLSLGIVGVRAFALGRAVFRYLERLTGHDAVPPGSSRRFGLESSSASCRSPPTDSPRADVAISSRASSMTSTNCRTSRCGSCSRS